MYSEEEKISKIIDVIDMRKYTICGPGKFAVISNINP